MELFYFFISFTSAVLARTQFEAQDDTPIKSQHELRDSNPLIVGGNPALIERFPWQLSVRINGNHRCGASLISKNRALTAAHCFRAGQESFDQFTVLAGSTLRLGDGGSWIIGVDKFIQHPNFDVGTLINDIAVLWLQHDLRFSERIRPVYLPKQDQPIVFNSTAMISGWGYRVEGDPTTVSDVLQFTTLTVFPNVRCEDTYGKWFKEGMFCAGIVNGGRDACQGDSGGPLTTNGLQVGIISWGVRCGDRHYPGIYTNIAKFRSWIDSEL